MDRNGIPSMSTDNTGDTARGQALLAAVAEGMRVVDAAGDEIGKVDRLHMGDPDAVTVSPAEDDAQRGTIFDDFAGLVFAEGSGLPETLRGRLLREGFLHVDGKGWFDTDYFVLPEQVAAVGGGVVRLTVGKNDLIEA